MIRYCIHIIFFLTIFLSGSSITPPIFASDCKFNGEDIIADFKKCNPDPGVRTEEGINLKVTEDADFRDIMTKFIRRVQILTSVVAIGVIVWIGLILVLPTKAESKESAKANVISVVLGFLFMIAATIVVNGIINILYEVFK